MRLCTASGADIPREVSFELIGGGRFGQSGQKLWRLDVADRAVPQPRKDICFEAYEQLHRVARFPVRRVFLEPLARDRLEGILGGIEGHEFFMFARGARIDAICDQLAHLVAPVARLLQSHVRIYTERNPLLLAREAILETPPATPGRRDLQIQTAAVEQAH